MALPVPEYDMNDIVEMKKQHPCRKSTTWKIIRMGADIRIKCLYYFPALNLKKN